jgi:hypothetical protein
MYPMGTTLAAHLVDRVIPDVPVRQRGLSLPWSLHYLLAFDAAHCRHVLAVFIRVVFGGSGAVPPATELSMASAGPSPSFSASAAR